MGSNNPVQRYSATRGYFKQEDNDTDAATFDFVKGNLGLRKLSQNGTDAEDWSILADGITELNRQGKSTGQSYKLFFAARHGQGFHNVGESTYGTAAWDDHWSKLDGDGKLVWSDPLLTDVGKEQVGRARDFWRLRLNDSKMPAPESYYASPLYRCLATCDITFHDQNLEGRAPYRPIVKELLREVNGVHTCDRRSTKSYLQSEWPNFEFEAGFTQDDELWRPDHRETDDELDARSQALLDDIFETDHNTVISLTTHSGWIQSLLRVTGHRRFYLETGGVIPLVVRRDDTAR